jgi:NADH pyrophosphatase NudC (nudix superfamily)
MVGFFAYAKSLEISVDKKELEGKCKTSGMTC